MILLHGESWLETIMEGRGPPVKGSEMGLYQGRQTLCMAVTAGSVKSTNRLDPRTAGRMTARRSAFILTLSEDEGSSSPRGRDALARGSQTTRVNQPNIACLWVSLIDDELACASQEQ